MLACVQCYQLARWLVGPVAVMIYESVAAVARSKIYRPIRHLRYRTCALATLSMVHNAMAAVLVGAIQPNQIGMLSMTNPDARADMRPNSTRQHQPLSVYN